MPETTKSHLTERSGQLDDRLRPQASSRKLGTKKSRIPTNSFFYDRIVPLLIVIFSIALIFILLLVAGLALGVIPSVLPSG